MRDLSRHGRSERLDSGKAQGIQGLALDDRCDQKNCPDPTNDLKGPGRFGRMFPDLPALESDDAKLEALGNAMREMTVADTWSVVSTIPAGFTYLGQFIDHDITLDRTEGFPGIDDPLDIEQARTPNLDLDSLYGNGPKLQKELYEGPRPRSRFRIGQTNPVSIGDPAILYRLFRCPTTFVVVARALP